MKKLNLTFALFFLSIVINAQMDLPPSGNNPRATISEEVGITSITIKYSRPDVNKREGKIFGDGKLVPFGFKEQNDMKRGFISFCLRPFFAWILLALSRFLPLLLLR